MIWDDLKPLGFDVETSGAITGQDAQGRDISEYALQPWRVAQGKAWLTSFVWAQIATPPDIRGKLMPTVADLRAMLDYAIEHGNTIVGWNIVFDIQWLIAYGLGDLVDKIKWLDGMLLWRHLFIEPEYDMDKGKKKSYGLKTAVAEFLPIYAGYEEDVEYHNPDPKARAKLFAYNKRDVVFTLLIAKTLWDDLTDKQRACALIEAACLPMVARANLEGMVVDTLAARELRQYLTDTATQKLVELAPHGVTETIVRSPLKMAALLFDDWGLPVLKENTGKKTGKVSRATDKEVLHELAFIDPRAKTLREYREALNNRTKFADAPLVSADYNADGKSHPAALVFGTYSGRLTYGSKQGRNKDERQTGFALHQEKRDKVFRNIILPPPGYTLMEFDASGQEFRWMAICADDPTMLHLCRPGEDAHSYMGARIAGVDYRGLIADVHAEDKNAKDTRQLGKVGNLSLQYRTSARKLRSVARVQYNIPIELPEAQRIHRTYQLTYQRVPRYWNEQIQLTKHLGYVETLAGRRVRVVGDWEGNFGWSMGSTAINYRIQGTGADQKYLALAVLRPYLTRIGACFAWDLHDGIYLYVPDAMVARAAVEIKYLLDHLPYKSVWGFTPPIDLPWDVKAGPSWGQLTEWKPT